MLAYAYHGWERIELRRILMNVFAKYDKKFALALVDGAIRERVIRRCQIQRSLMFWLTFGFYFFGVASMIFRIIPSVTIPLPFCFAALTWALSIKYESDLRLLEFVSVLRQERDQMGS
jgi:hypothetical protein